MYHDLWHVCILTYNEPGAKSESYRRLKLLKSFKIATLGTNRSKHQ